MRRFFELNGLFPQLALNELFDLLNNFSLGDFARFMPRAFQQLHERMNRQSGGQFREFSFSAPMANFTSLGFRFLEPADKGFAMRLIWGWHLHFQNLWQPRDSVMQEAARFGEQDHGVFAVQVAGIRKPVVANADATAICI